LKPLQRAGNRRYYRPADVALARRIHRLLNEEGNTVKGVQKLLKSKDVAEESSGPRAAAAPQRPQFLVRRSTAGQGSLDIDRLKSVRDQLAAALQD
jgi:DNA-binding transcriptional MerR regulator